MAYDRNKPLIVQRDMTVLLDVRHADADAMRAQLMRFAQLVKTPWPMHTYRLTPLSLWNAAASGVDGADILRFLQEYGRTELPEEVGRAVGQIMGRYGLIRLEAHGERLRLVVDAGEPLRALEQCEAARALCRERLGSHAFAVEPGDRGPLKQAMLRLGFPVLDLAGYRQAEPLVCRLREGEGGFALRDYQRQAVDAFLSEDRGGGSGLLVLPCGAGKTLIGIAVMAELGKACLILTTHVASVRQWRDEILAKTDLAADRIGEYTGARKDVRPVTITTYQMLTYRPGGAEHFPHMELFRQRAWGLIIYDEVHLLPAPVFRATADIQATRRLGLTATLVREDGREEDVFSLIGPKRFEMPWKALEAKGWIAPVACEEIRVPLPEAVRRAYMSAGAREQHRIAGENPAKLEAAEAILDRHAGMPAIVIGQYLGQLERIAERLRAPLISGRMPHDARERLYAEFRNGCIRVLVVSKVANFAVDLPNAGVLIQLSGSFGSRQEEAQRLGRVLRPKAGGSRAHFYTLVSENTREQDFAWKRRLFLLEQGYRYRVTAAEEWMTRCTSE
jgi:DNA excision repair protein ERCC-3